MGTGCWKRIGLGALSTLAIVAALAMPAASAHARTPVRDPVGRRYLRDCGDFRAGVTWHLAEFSGDHYVYQVENLRCHSRRPETDAYIIAILGLHGEHHPYGFSCTLKPRVDAGYCYKGNLHKPAALHYIAWEPED